MNAYTYPFEKLDVYQKAEELISLSYLICKELPKSEDFILAQQLKRAALSVSANIAEGSGRASSNDRAHFINLAYSSALECISHVRIASKLQLIQPTQEKKYRLLVNQVTLQLNRYYQYHLKQGNHLRDLP